MSGDLSTIHVCNMYRTDCVAIYNIHYTIFSSTRNCTCNNLFMR